MATATANGIQIEYETFGSPADPALLLVNGYTTQLTGWDARLCALLAARGRFVVRYDNRDVGLSTHFDGQRALLGEVFRYRRGEAPRPEVPYTLSDMAADGIGLLDALGIARAHVAGSSMGGMIVQTMAIEHPDRVASLTSVMSHTGERDVGRSTKEANDALMALPPVERDAYVEHTLRTGAVWASRRYLADERELRRARAGADFDRMFYPEGGSRQMAAIMVAPDRADALRSLDVPTLVIHGRDDTLITPSGGERTAELVPGAHLLLVADMGHDVPVALWPLFVGAITAIADLGEARPLAGARAAAR
jgi:pimeloyl-ACP methyl ester carboxylesterase